MHAWVAAMPEPACRPHVANSEVLFAPMGLPAVSPGCAVLLVC
jgi:hypothetical protein